MKSKEGRSLIYFLVFAGSHAGFAFEEVPESGLARKIQAVGNLADKHILVFKQYFRLYQCGAVNPIHHAMTAYLRYQT